MTLDMTKHHIENTKPRPALSRYIHYLMDGSLVQRTRARWKSERRERRRAWWLAEYKKGRQYKDIHLQPGIRIRLFWNSEISWLLYVKDFEASERAFHNAFLRTGDIYLDIGANIGLFTLIAARRVGRSGRVFAFEPVSSTYESLLQNISLNRFKNVRAYQFALSDAMGSAEMTVSLDGFDGRNSMAKPTGGEKFTKETVAISTLDHFVTDTHLAGKITMVKIDVEGWEIHVLEGAKTALAAPDAPLLQVEFTEEALRMANSSSKDLYQTLKQFGYKMFIFNAEEGRLIPVSVEDVQDRFVNVIATKQPAMVLARLEE
jgi:FkbM family methyltransferase